MSTDDFKLNTAWAALHCGDHEFLEQILPEQRVMEMIRVGDSGKQKESLGFTNEELLLEFANNYRKRSNIADKRANQTVMESDDGLLRCVIWPQSSFSFEGRAFLTKLDPSSERLLAGNIRSEFDSKSQPNKQIGSSISLQDYSGQWRFEGDHIIAEITSCDFGVFVIDAIVKPPTDSSPRTDFLDDVKTILNKLA